MRILIANKFYYPRGGDCIYSISLEKLLTEAGHEVAFFTMNNPQNLENPWKKYWPSEVSFSPKKPIQFLKAFFRPFGDKETKKKFTKLIDTFKPDILHLNNIHTQLSPIIAEIAHQRGIRVVWTLHDYKLICPAYSCLSNQTICEKCFGGNKKNCVRNKCLKKNRLASFIATKEAETWNRERLEKCVDIFICPSFFMKQKMEQGGFSSDKLQVLHNFIDSEKLKGSSLHTKNNFYCYIGRLSEEKGIRTLLSAASELPYTLKVLGTGPLENKLRQHYSQYQNIEFMGHCDWNICKSILASSKFSVIPSEWYENNPLSVIESLCLGTPVLGADIGGIPELIKPDITGQLFESGNAEDLKVKIRAFFKQPVFMHPLNSELFSSLLYRNKLTNLYLRKNSL